MPKVHLWLINGIAPPFPSKMTEHPFEICQPANYGGPSIILKISPTGDTIESRGSVELPSQLVKSLTSTAPGDLSEKVRQAMQEQFASLQAAHQRLLRLVTQELELDESRVLTSGSQQWSCDESTWTTLPISIVFTNEFLRPGYCLDTEWQAHMQALLDRGEKPLMAFEHLHEAIRNLHKPSTGGVRFSWIEATIAAELAIKQVLITLEPRLRALLLEVPAPPLQKLYGPILEDVAGEKSPYVKQLQKGAEIRNRLVHRPELVRFGPQDAADYITVVDKAIWHLVGLCRRAVDPRFHRSALWRSQRTIIP